MISVVEVVNFGENSAIVLLDRTETGNLPGPGKVDGKPVDF